MIKVGIITLVGSDNCGSLLQTYALQTYLEENYDCKVDIINYKDSFSAKTYGIFSPAIFMRPVQLLRTVQHYKRIKKQQLDYAKFRSNELHMTEREYHNLGELKKENWNYDILISGSDQVWNWPEAYVDETYFLDWGGDGVRRIAYAPSTGGSIDPENSLLKWVDDDAATLKKIRDCLSKFQMISVREESGQQYLQRLLGQTIPLVADPTLMLDSISWRKIAGSANVKGDYIFYYSYGYKNDELNQLVSKAAEKLGLPVYVINASLWNHKNNKKLNFNIHSEGGPYAYLSLMKHAKYVFAESFHGCIFAFIFQRNFWFMNNFSDGRIEARINSLLEYLELKDRIIHAKNFDAIQLETPIDYEAPFNKLEELRKLSREYLNKAINTKEAYDYTKDSVEYKITQNVQWQDMSEEGIREKFDEIKPYAMHIKSQISQRAFKQYFNVEKDEIADIDTNRFLGKIVNSTSYQQKMEYKRLRAKYGYLGHLLFRTKQKFSEGGVKGVIKAIVIKYKWWFRIGY